MPAEATPAEKDKIFAEAVAGLGWPEMTAPKKILVPAGTGMQSPAKHSQSRVCMQSTRSKRFN